MKRIGVLLALFCVGLLAASFAFADDGGKGKGKNETTGSTSTTSSGKKCKNVSLKGTAAATTFTVTVDKSSKAGRDLKGKPATLTFSGKVNINARMCSAGTTGATPGGRDLRAPEPQGRQIEPRAPTSTERQAVRSFTRRAFGALLAFLGRARYTAHQHSADSAGLPLRRQAHVRYPGGLRRCSACPRPSARRSSSRTTFLEEASSLDDPGRCA